MAFKDILGQDQAIKALQSDLARDSIYGTYLFTGPEGVGKKLTALNFAKVLNCKNGKGESCDVCSSCQKIDRFEHPDVYSVQPIGNVIKIEQSRALQERIKYKPYQGEKKVFIIEQAEKMTPQTANSLLKTLEEPPSHAVIILLSTRRQEVLSTILSRSRMIEFFPLDSAQVESILRKEYPDISQKAPLMARLARGRPGEALRLARDDKFLQEREELLSQLTRMRSLKSIFEFSNKWANYSRDDLEKILDLIEGWFRDIIIFKLGGQKEIINLDKEEDLRKLKDNYFLSSLCRLPEIITKTRKFLRANVGVQLSLENLGIELVKLYWNA